jgi:hypothetical protein
VLKQLKFLAHYKSAEKKRTKLKHKECGQAIAEAQTLRVTRNCTADRLPETQTLQERRIVRCLGRDLEMRVGQSNTPSIYPDSIPHPSTLSAESSLVMVRHPDRRNISAKISMDERKYIAYRPLVPAVLNCVRIKTRTGSLELMTLSSKSADVIAFVLTERDSYSNSFGVK